MLTLTFNLSFHSEYTKVKYSWSEWSRNKQKNGEKGSIAHKSRVLRHWKYTFACWNKALIATQTFFTFFFYVTLGYKIWKLWAMCSCEIHCLFHRIMSPTPICGKDGTTIGWLTQRSRIPWTFQTPTWSKQSGSQKSFFQMQRMPASNLSQSPTFSSGFILTEKFYTFSGRSTYLKVHNLAWR